MSSVRRRSSSAFVVRSFRVVLGAGLALGVLACSGGGGSGGSRFDSSAQLLAVTFPDPGDVNAEPEDAPPKSAPLAQQIVFTFTGRPDPNRVSALTLRIDDATGLPVPGTYAVNGTRVTFTPALPLRPITVASNGVIDAGGAGLSPGASYSVRVGPRTFSFVASVEPTLRARFADPQDPGGVLIGFATTSNVASLLAGLPAGTPQLVHADPADGQNGVSPNLYGDPDHLFPPRRVWSLEFDRAIRPDQLGTGSDAFHLIDLDDHDGLGGSPSGLELGLDARLTVNEADRSVVELRSSGILPFGHLLALAHATDLKGLSEAGTPGVATMIATTFTTASAPSTSIRDELLEDFETTDRQDRDAGNVAAGAVPARWDRLDSNVLQAGFAFEGDGQLGRFAPPAPPSGTTHVIVLDTSKQVFPLPDGSTPDAPPGAAVQGGVFSFTDIDVPSGVVITPIGSNPLVLTATGSVRIGGQIVIAGQAGTPENAYDSAVTSVPGGAGVAGGGRGGESHPIVFFPPGNPSVLSLVSPLAGGSGYGIDRADGLMKRIGGTGGQCGCLDQKSGGKYGTDQEQDCSAFRGSHANEKVPGGGGGSMLVAGTTPAILDKVGGTRIADANGIGNVLPDGSGSFIVRDDKTLLCGVAGQAPFADDGDATNDFFGARGQLTRMIGGQGGGGGASLTESYYCGIWCDHDADPNNDNVCKGDAFGPNPAFGDSVADARGGGGGAGGGALLIQALGSITIGASARIDANGGAGMGGEAVGCSYWGGGGGGGAGGMVVLQSATAVTVQSGARIDVRGGVGDKAENDNFFFTCDDGLATGNAGDGGAGGAGLIQLQVPPGQLADVANPDASLVPRSSWIDPSNTLDPAEFGPKSVAVARWFDLGRVTQRAPANTNPLFTFAGLDAQGFVATDAQGDVLAPATSDIVCGYLGQLDPASKLYRRGEEPRADFVPPGATVRVEFQGADAIAPGSKEVDPASFTPWDPSPSIASGRQFLRWRITFDIAADGSAITPTTRLPVVERIRVHAEF